MPLRGVRKESDILRPIRSRYDDLIVSYDDHQPVHAQRSNFPTRRVVDHALASFDQPRGSNDCVARRIKRHGTQQRIPSSYIVPSEGRWHTVDTFGPFH